MSGKMAEWSIAAVLKTVELQGSGGSNPSLSAEDGREDVRRGDSRKICWSPFVFYVLCCSRQGRRSLFAGAMSSAHCCMLAGGSFGGKTVK